MRNNLLNFVNFYEDIKKKKSVKKLKEEIYLIRLLS